MDDGAAKAELVTIAIIAYRQEGYVREAIASAFAQTYQPLEILLSDDNSPDGTFAIMQEMAAAYRGPHQVRLNRNPQNLGLVGHVNRIFELARGVLIVPNAGDDISLPHRVERLYQAFAADRPLLVHSDILDMDESGALYGRQRGYPRGRRLARHSLLKVARSDQLCVGASCAWSPELMRVFGPLTEPAGYEDRAFFFRARLAGQVAYVDEKLVKYRRGVGIASGNEQSRRKQLAVQRGTFRQELQDFERYAEAMRRQLSDLIEEAEAGLRALEAPPAPPAPPVLPEHAEGERVFLRLVREEDAGFVHALRIDPAYNAHLSRVTGTVEDQRAWIAAYKAREAAGTEAYYIICRREDGRPCGTVRLYGIGEGRFTWGSWILNGDKPAKAALDSAVQVYRIGFGALGLARAVFDVRNDNDHTLAFHHRFGAHLLKRDEQDSHFDYSATDFAAAEAGLAAKLKEGS